MKNKFLVLASIISFSCVYSSEQLSNQKDVLASVRHESKEVLAEVHREPMIATEFCAERNRRQKISTVLTVVGVGSVLGIGLVDNDNAKHALFGLGGLCGIAIGCNDYFLNRKANQTLDQIAELEKNRQSK